jgi:hypothetical protein
MSIEKELGRLTVKELKTAIVLQRNEIDRLRAQLASRAGVPTALLKQVEKHLTVWLDMNCCDCEYGHSCGRTEVERDRDALSEYITAAPAAPAAVGDEREAAKNAQPQPAGVVDDCVIDALNNLEHDNYEQSYSGYQNRLDDIGLIRAALGFCGVSRQAREVN